MCSLKLQPDQSSALPCTPPTKSRRNVAELVVRLTSSALLRLGQLAHHNTMSLINHAFRTGSLSEGQFALAQVHLGKRVLLISTRDILTHNITSMGRLDCITCLRSLLLLHHRGFGGDGSGPDSDDGYMFSAIETCFARASRDYDSNSWPNTHIHIMSPTPKCQEHYVGPGEAQARPEKRQPCQQPHSPQQRMPAVAPGDRSPAAHCKASHGN